MGAAGVAWYGADSLRHRRESGHGYDLRGELDIRSEAFLRAAEALTGAPDLVGQRRRAADQRRPDLPLLPARRSARRARRVCLLTYVYWRGDIAHEVADALCERARAGVECNVLIDAVGGVKLERRADRADGRRRACASPLPAGQAVRRASGSANRTHRKILVADGRVGLTGGVGIAEEWTGDAEDPDHWRDTHVRVSGPVVRGLFGAFAENWLEATGEVLVGDGYLPELERDARAAGR